MWIFLKDAFLSVVADREDPTSGNLLVRARRQGDIETVFEPIVPGGVEVFSVPGSDYAYRAWVSRDTLKKAMQSEVDNLDYSNFKNAIEDEEYHDAALGVWTEMYRYQQRTQPEGSLNFFYN